VAAGTTTAAERVEGPRWRLPAGATSVRYRIDLRRMEHDVRAASDASRVRDGYIGVLGYSVFGYVDGFEGRPIAVTVEGPRDWPVFRSCRPARGELVDASAADFYALADSQIVMGPRAVFRRLAERPVALFLASYAEGDVDLDRVGRLVTTAVERVAAYFGEVPFAHYTVHLGTGGRSRRTTYTA
jgi:predicted metalloprotease with PDZ domain